VQGQLNSTIDSLASDFANLPPETREHLLKAAQPLGMPTSWSQDKAEAWSKLDRSVQDYVLARENQAQEKITQQGHELAELRRAGGVSAELGGVLERYSNHIPRGQDGQPMAPPQVLESLLSAHHALEQNPAAAIAWLAQSYGLDLGQLGVNPATSAEQAQ
jgi:hypothetical protein